MNWKDSLPIQPVRELQRPQSLIADRKLCAYVEERLGLDTF